jgi:enoyl-CoA hydratase/carnithine racemase
MLRRRVCVPAYLVSVDASSSSASSAASTSSRPVADVQQRRGIKTLDVREYRPLGTPIEFRFYQRYANHPNRQSGVQFLTHYNTHQRFRVNKDFIDYMHWGKEQGQARLPHRHQRVAFDFDDSLQPTRAEGDTSEWFAGQDPTIGADPDISHDFDPYKKVFSHPEHWNKMFSKRRPGEGDIQLDVLPSNSLLGPMVTQTDTQEMAYFKLETRGPTHGRVPGVNAPFQGERDRRMMQAMSYPLNHRHTLTGNDGRFSKTIFMNDPKRHQALSAVFARDLNKEIDKATNALYSKLTVLTSAQSGQTEYFCGGVDMEAVGFDLAMANMLRSQAAELIKSSAPGKKTEVKVQELLRDADRYEERADSVLRENAAVIWRAYTSPRPLMTLVNGKCRGTGCGLALAAKYAGLMDASEFLVDGPNCGLTPFSGMTRLLARPETSLKYPGLAEFVMLTGTSLFAGDALRLGWTDLFTTLPDMTYHIKDWFDSTEHMHNDAVAWQLGHLLEKCFQMKDGAHSTAMERAAMSPIRARWVEDAFADQPSVEAIVDTLTAMEKLPCTDRHNTCDPSYATPYTLSSVAEGVRKLEATRLRYTLSPWDVTPPEEEVTVRQAAEVFTSYVLERRGDLNIVGHRDRHKAQTWREQREREYVAYSNLRHAPHTRHVYAKLEGCEGTLVDFDFTIDPAADAAAALASQKKSDSADAAEEAQSTASLDRLKEAVRTALKMPADRDIDLCWYLPTLDTCPVWNDQELVDVLHNDPGLEDPAAQLRYPPIYFLVKRNTLYLSEWAFAVKHQLLLQSPYALKATLLLLKEVRGNGSAEAVRSLADTLALEYRYVTRMLKRDDFRCVGQHVDKSSEEWQMIKEERARNVHKVYLPTRPLPDYEAVFERDVVMDGHRFQLRPRWSPRTLAEVTTDSLDALAAPLDFDKDGAVELDVVIQANKSSRMAGMIDDAGGYEVVPNLGEVDKDGRLKVAPLQGDARVPTNVNFYEMARHPWEDTASSWRRDGFTEGSKEYFEHQYKKAAKAVYDEAGRGQYNYWPSKDATDSVAGEEEPNQLLEERFFSKLRDAERGVEMWARQLRKKAVEGKLENKTEIATQQEKIYDDEYYRWFIQPGHNPNPSGLLRGRKGVDSTETADKELEVFLNELLHGARSTTDAAENAAFFEQATESEDAPEETTEDS